MTMGGLSVQESRQMPVDPGALYCPTGLKVAPGQRCWFLASGKWRDGWLCTCGPNGWPGGPFEAFNRLPWHRFFLLCGTVGEDDARAFPIGEGREWWVPEAAGGLDDRRLFLFANDWRGFYFNNHAVPPEKGGPLTVTITRLG
jgi:hypothetical protein